MLKGKVRKTVKPFIIIVIAILALILFAFIGWFIVPGKELDVVILNKTVPAANERSEADQLSNSNYYRKHIGLNWILKQQKYVHAGTREGYDHRDDYYGPIIDENGKVLSERKMSSIEHTPDVVYLADAYGSELKENIPSNLNEDDMSVASLAYSKGATLIAEMELNYNQKEGQNEKSQLLDLCGITDTGWSGRYIVELQDFEDVPDWAPGAYESKYGVEWRFSGPGILLVSDSGDIIVLEEKTDFESRNLLNISINDKYKSEFGSCTDMNFYNWFELITVSGDTEAIANFEFDLNATGMEKFKPIASNPVFTAVSRKVSKVNSAPAYYFAGDFCDYVKPERLGTFLFADHVFRFLSFHKDGDITEFYWKFYTPMVKKILNDTYKRLKNNSTADETVSSVNPKIVDNRFEVDSNGTREQLTLNAFNMNAYEPGEKKYTRNYKFYQDLFTELSKTGANCVKVYDVLPPEFYRALYDSNRTAGRNKVYLLQTIGLPNNVAQKDIMSQQAQTLLRQNISDAITAVNGSGSIDACGTRESGTYKHSVIDCLIGFVVDLDITTESAQAIMASSYQPSQTEYLTAGANKVEAYLASIADYVFTTYKEKNGNIVPVGIEGCEELITGAFWNENKEYSFNLDNLATNDLSKEYFFVSYKMSPSDYIVLNNKTKFTGYTDDYGFYTYGGYLQAVKNTQKNHPVLVSGCGYSTNTNMFEADSTVNGLSEEEQGTSLVRMLTAVRSVGYLGGVISDFNDSWSGNSNEFYASTVPFDNNALWHNLADPAETSGVVAIDAQTASTPQMEISDTERLQKVQFNADPEYLYITALLTEQMNYGEEKLFIGLDTYQRNDGEYRYDKNFYANSLSGMEFMIKINSKNDAGLYVANSYNRNKGKYSSKESYKAKFDLVTQLEYGNFNLSNTQINQTGTSINIRIPWSMLNITDPSQMLVINADKQEGSQLKTTFTNGILFSMFVGEISTKDTKSIFPVSKKSTGYKTFAWSKWEKVDYTIRTKSSFDTISTFFKSNAY